jgi:hypothetical protein
MRASPADRYRAGYLAVSFGLASPPTSAKIKVGIWLEQPTAFIIGAMQLTLLE